MLGDSGRGISYILKPDREYNRAIPNTKKEGLANTGSSKDFKSMLSANMRVSAHNLYEGQLIANCGQYGIRENLTEHRVFY